MKKQRLMKVGVAASVLAVPLLVATSTFAFGPERDTYTMANPADHAVFNSITDNNVVGDERDFVRVAEKTEDGSFVNELEIEPGKTYEVQIYYHNDASETYNDSAHNYVGVAKDTRMSSTFPERVNKGERKAITGRITSTTTNPEAVWDEAYVTAKEDLTLHYVPGTAKIYNQWATNGSILPTSLFSTEGTFIGQDELDGLIMGCGKFSGQVLYTITAHAVDGETPVDPDDPEVPDELPTTGPAEIVLAVVIVIAVCAGGVYWWKTSKEVKKTTKRAKGRR